MLYFNNPIFMKKLPIVLAVAATVLFVGCSMSSKTETQTEYDNLQKQKMEQQRMMDEKMEQEAMMKKDEGTSVMVGGAAMYSTKNIVENVVNAPNLTTLVAAVKAAGLVETLSGTGPFTVFGPDNNAFEKLPAGTVETLVKPENKAMLSNILTYHVVSGTYLASDLKDGQTLTTVQGGKLTVMVKDGAVWIKDENGGMAKVLTPNVLQKNGVAHVIDTVLMPKK